MESKYGGESSANADNASEELGRPINKLSGMESESGFECIEKRYEEISPDILYFFKRSHLRHLSNEMRVAIDECILELGSLQPPQSVFRNMQLIIQPDLNSDDRVLLLSGNCKNALVAFRDAEKADGDEMAKIELVWFREGPECKKTPLVFKLLPYIVFALILVGVYGFLLSHFVLHDFKIRAQAEGVMTVRAYTADLHHDRLNEFYKLPNQNAEGQGMIQYPYKGD